MADTRPCRPHHGREVRRSVIFLNRHLQPCREKSRKPVGGIIRPKNKPMRMAASKLPAPTTTQGALPSISMRPNRKPKTQSVGLDSTSVLSARFNPATTQSKAAARRNISTIDAIAARNIACPTHPQNRKYARMTAQITESNFRDRHFHAGPFVLTLGPLGRKSPITSST